MKYNQIKIKLILSVSYAHMWQSVSIRMVDEVSLGSAAWLAAVVVSIHTFIAFAVAAIYKLLTIGDIEGKTSAEMDDVYSVANIASIMIAAFMASRTIAALVDVLLF